MLIESIQTPETSTVSITHTGIYYNSINPIDLRKALRCHHGDRVRLIENNMSQKATETKAIEAFFHERNDWRRWQKASLSLHVLIGQLHSYAAIDTQFEKDQAIAKYNKTLALAGKSIAA